MHWKQETPHLHHRIVGFEKQQLIQQNQYIIHFWNECTKARILNEAQTPVYSNFLTSMMLINTEANDRSI